MLIGKVPFRGDSPISIALQHINDDIDFTSEEKVRIPQSVRTTIKKLTEKSSADRYQTAEELIEDIEYIEKNIDLDFIKEYDDFATKKIDEKEINKVVNPTLAKPAPEKVVKPVEVADLDDDEDYYDDFYEEDDDEDEEEEEIMRAKKNQRPKSTPSKRTKKKKKKQESPKSRRRLKVIAAVLILILCAQVFLAYKFLFAGGFGNKSLTVPNLVNMTLEEAQSAVEKEGLYLSVKSEEYNSEVDENCIISQTPEGGSTNVKKGDTINVVVSKGSSQASVPNVVGLTLSNAKQLIEEEFLLVPRDERPQLAEEVIRRALSRSDTEVVLIDGINVLFAPILNLNPLELLKTISKTYPIVVGWRGHLEGDQLYLEHNNDPKHAVVTITKPERVMVID